MFVCKKETYRISFQENGEQNAETQLYPSAHNPRSPNVVTKLRDGRQRNLVGNPTGMADCLFSKASPKDKAHPASCSMGIGGSFLEGKVTGA